MRQYGTLWSSFWTGDTGKKLGRFPDAQRLAAYLVCGPLSNAIGVYYLPLPMMCHDVPLTAEGAYKALRSLDDLGFAYYDIPTEWVWVPEMAHYQLGPSLQTTDNRHKSVLKMLAEIRKCTFAKDFWVKYREAYRLPNMDFLRPLVDEIKGACEGLQRGGGLRREGEGKGDREGEGKGNEGCSEAASRPSLPPKLSPETLDYPAFGCTRGRRNGPETWLLTTEFIGELQQTFEGIDVAAECRKAWQWHKTNWAKRKTADGMPDFLRRWVARANDSGRGKARPTPPESRVPTAQDDANWNPVDAGLGGQA